MGLRGRTIEYINSMISNVGFSLVGLRMCELGNQLIKDGYGGFFVAKDYFESLGVVHTSIDSNGLDGALPLDLNTKLKLGKFDVITNMGTSEHVKDNKQCFENIHNLCRDGGIMIHLLPATGTKHGIRQYDSDWFEKLAADKNYEVLSLMVKLNNTTEYVWCTLRKSK